MAKGTCNSSAKTRSASGFCAAEKRPQPKPAQRPEGVVLTFHTHPEAPLILLLFLSPAPGAFFFFS